MKIAAGLALMVVASVSHAECSEGQFMAAPYCFTPAQAKYACEYSGATEVGMDQVIQCLDSWLLQNGRLEPLDRANCIGEDVVSDVEAENLPRCR